MTGVSRAIIMNGTVEWQSGWADRTRRIVAARHATVVTGAVLSALAVGEAMLRASVTGDTLQFALVLCLLAVSTTLPLCLGRPVGAAAAITAASLVSLAFFHTLTVAGLAGQLFVLYRLGLAGSWRKGAAQLSAAALRPAIRGAGVDRSGPAGVRGRDPHFAAGFACTGSGVGRARPPLAARGADEPCGPRDHRR